MCARVLDVRRAMSEYTVNLPSWLELRVPMITDDIREFGTRYHVWSTGSELVEVYSPCVNNMI
jgi:hypothetical protein